jgi:hypothetical protein
MSEDRHPDKAEYLRNLGNSLGTRFEHTGNLSDLENAISNLQQAVQLTGDKHPNQAILSDLGSILGTRFKHRGDLADLKNAISNHYQAIQLIGDGDPNKGGYHTILARFQ